MKSYNEYQEIVNRSLEPQLRSIGSIPDQLLEAMLYSLMAGGKRLRPVLLLAACDMAGGSLEESIPFACALEMIHTYSLIHDDLPGMDNDDLRRGRPTNHKAYGEGLAILAGDGLLNGAMELVLSASLKFKDFKGVRAAEILMRHAGVTGMIAGQTMDVTMEGCTPSEKLVSYIHTHKTSDLIQAAVEAGMMLAGCSEAEIESGRMFGYHLGIAFQIVDDLLDVTGDPEVLGKNTGKDDNKLTWVALRGINGARCDAKREGESAISALKYLPWNHDFFDKLAQENLNRVY